MATNWFYWRDGERVGPVSGAELKRLAASGVVSPSTTIEDETGKTALAERVAGLWVAPSPFALDAKIDRVSATAAASLETLETRFVELAERLERVETRDVDAENAERANAAANAAADAAFETLEKRLGEWDAALTAIVEKIDALTKRAAAIERRLDKERRQAKENAVAPSRSTGALSNDGAGGEFDAPAGTFYGGTDFPVGRYRIEVRRGRTAVVYLRNKKDGVGSWYLCDENPAIITEVRDGWKFSSTGPTGWTFLSALLDEPETERKKRKEASSETPSDYRLPSGKHRVGTDIPPGRYRAEIRRGYALVEVETRDDYEGYNLDTDVDSDDYNPSCVLDLRSGAKLTLDKPVDFTYLGALR